MSRLLAQLSPDEKWAIIAVVTGLVGAITWLAKLVLDIYRSRIKENDAAREREVALLKDTVDDLKGELDEYKERP